MKQTLRVSASVFFVLLLTGIGCVPRRGAPTAMAPGEYLCISLKNLSIAVREALENNRAVPDSLDTLQGMNWIEGYVVDSANNDIIIFGLRKPDRPVYQLTDILVNYQNVFKPDVQPYCSLDPEPENILAVQKLSNSDEFTKLQDIDEKRRLLAEATGLQKTVIGGVPRDSRYAFTLIEADYHMKKVSQGLVSVPNVTSSIDWSIENADPKNQLPGASRSRFFFHIKKNDSRVYPNYHEGAGIVRIAECPVVLLTEQQMADEQGNLSDIQEQDPSGVAFAQNMTREFSALTSLVPSYAMMENYFRLHALLLAMRYRMGRLDRFQDINTFFMNASFTFEKELPDGLPGLANIRQLTSHEENDTSLITRTRIFMVSGGVGMAMDVQTTNLVETAVLTPFKEDVISLKPGPTTIVWNVRVAETTS